MAKDLREASEGKQFPRFFNREISWIEFNKRVLEEARRTDKPLLERLRFLAIVSANLDEFFMVRMAGLKRQVKNGNYTTCPSHMSPQSQLSHCAREIKTMIEAQYRCLTGEIFPGLKEKGLVYKNSFQELSSDQQSYVKIFFQNQVFPLLTPVRVNLEAPNIPGTNLRLQVAFLLKAREGAEFIASSAEEEYLAIVQVPSALDRIVFLPDRSDEQPFILLESLIVQYSHTLFPGYQIMEHLIFRVTRDADFGVDESRDEDFVEAMEQVLNFREKSTPVRLTVGLSSGRLQELLQRSLELEDHEVYPVPEPLELASLMNLAFIHGFDELKLEGWSPIEPRSLSDEVPVWESIRQKDHLLHHPFESFNPVIRMLEEAAEDPRVLAIKMTLYRTSGNSPIIRALEIAAQNGKQVTVLVELKARFDEQRNISWAERLERAGVIVIYGISQIKVHAKALLIIRQEATGISRYLHLGTGNYNEKTAKHYTDMSLLTSRDDLCYEAGLFFNAITGYSAIPTLNKLVMAPHGMKQKLIQLIEREAEKSMPEDRGLIIAKLNSLADIDVIEALYGASEKGVKIELNVRGLCMLVPGVPGQSKNIRVTGIIDRYLEHTRGVYFKNGGDEEIYLSSADWMPRNLERRVELMFPVEDPDLKARVKKSLQLCIKDRAQSYQLESDGSYHRVPDPDGKGVSSQWARYQLSKDTGRAITPVNKMEFSVRRNPAKGR